MHEEPLRDQRPVQRLRRSVAPGVEELGVDDSLATEQISPGDVAGPPPADDAEVDLEPLDDAEPPPPAAVVRPAGTGLRRLPGPDPFDPGRRGVAALAAVAVLVVAVAAYLTWRARPRAEPVTTAQTAVAASGGLAANADPNPDPPPTAASDGEVVVAVMGKVRRPGLVRLPTGARVADAIQGAGGLQPGADATFLNLARRLTDGELILVGVTPPPGVAGVGGLAGPGAMSGPGAAASSGAGTSTGPVNLNSATLAQLDVLPGVGPVLAQRIIDYRDQHGGFRTVSELRQVDGIGDTRYEQLKDLVTV